MAEDDDFLAQVLAEIDANTGNPHGSEPWTLYLIQALWPYPAGAERQDTLKRIRHRCIQNGRPLKPTFEQTVQRSFNHHNSDRGGKPPTHPLFHCGGRLGSGVWAVSHERARKWMVENRLKLNQSQLG